MDCKMVQQKIYSFIYGESNEHELRKIQEHLARCGDCAKEYRLIEEILTQMKSNLPDDPVPAGFRERVLDSIHLMAGEDS